MKRCSGCNAIKSKVEFYKNSANKDGLNSWCKECMKRYKKENSKKHNKWNRKYHRSHQEGYAQRMRRRRAALAGVRTEPYTRRQVWTLYGKVCHLCSGPINLKLRWPNPWSFSIDHVVPVSLGGDDILDNVRPSHLRCNISKGARAR